MTTPAPAPRRGWLSRLADLLVLLLCAASIVAVGEMAVRPFYPAPPPMKSPQVRLRDSPRFGWEMVPDPMACSFQAAAPIDVQGRRVGFSAPGERVEPDSTTRRWLLLGGGSAFGVGVDGPLCFGAIAARAGESGRPVQLVSAACEGYDLDQSLRRLEAEGIFLHPSLILVTIDPDDLPARGVRDSTFSSARFDAAARRFNRSRPADPGFYEELKEKSRLVTLIDGRVRAFLRLERSVPGPALSPDAAGVRAIDVLLGRETAALEVAWRTIEAELARIGTDARTVHAQVAVVALPIPAQLRRPYPRARYQSRLEAICRREGFLFIDPLPAMRAERQKGARLYLPRLSYLNPAGHRVVGEQIVRELETPLAHEGMGADDSLRIGESY